MHEVLIDRLIIEVSGNDALKFLQNLTTNDLGLNDYCYCYMLNNQGRYLFDFFVFKQSPQKLLIDIHKDHAELFKAKLMFYKLRSNIQIVTLNHCKILYSQEKPDCLFINSIIDPRFSKLGFRSIIENMNMDIHNFTKDLYLEDKYNYAIPDGYSDLIVDRSIPAEYGADELNAISYNKGCYMGQEVISRIKYQGKIRKKIFKITANADLSSYTKGDEIIVNDINIGIFCSSYKNQAIALIRIDKNIDLHRPIVINNIKLELSVPQWEKRDYEIINCW